MTTVLYPGTFNPIHNGHADLVERASILFDHVVMGIATSSHKSPSELELRVNLARKALSHIRNVEVVGFNTLTVDFAKEIGASVILKGIRTVTDFDYEFQMLNMNRALQPEIETVFLTASCFSRRLKHIPISRHHWCDRLPVMVAILRNLSTLPSQKR